MNRLQKKCFIASAGLHLLLFLILLIGPAFLASKEKLSNAQYIEIIPPNVIDGNFVGGGDPHAKPPPPAPVTQPPQPQVSAPTPPPLPEKAREPDPPKETRPPKPDAESLEAEKEHKQRKPQISTQLVARKPDSKPKSHDPSSGQVEAQARADAAKRAARFAAALQNLKEGLSSATTVGIIGPGGEAYAGYDIVLQSIYKARYDEALLAAGDIADGHSEAEASVTVERNGNVVSARLLNLSGNAALDKLVQRVLDRVTYIRPFPETSKDSQRVFTIVFDLKAKRAIG